MTDEEKAEEYVNKKLCFLCREQKSKTKCATCSTFLMAYKCYLDGLADGRKETEAHQQVIAICEKEAKINDLKAQIEKMKCCGNCSKPCWNPPIVRISECLNNNYSLYELAE